MKKIISLIVILSIIIAFFLTGTTLAASLDTLTVDVDKTTIRPGEDVILTINFGKDLGSYTFDIAYDNDIFEYKSVVGGTEHKSTDKVRVVFHDDTGGANPRQNMSITFTAKADITTSNPTELTVTAEGLANPDASITYDDIGTPIVKNITVEPEYKDYEIKLEHVGNIIANQEKDMVLSYSSSMGKYYEHARLVAEAQKPNGANVKLTGVDTNTNTEQDIIQSGWGDPQGYKIGGKDVAQVLNIKALFTDVGDYKITLKLIDRDNSDSVIAEREFSYTALEKEPEVTPPEEAKPEVTPEAPATKEEVKPAISPKTGDNIYVAVAILIISITSLGVYYSKKDEK